MDSQDTHNHTAERGGTPAANNEADDHAIATVNDSASDDGQTSGVSRGSEGVSFPVEGGQSSAHDPGTPSPPGGQVPQNPYLPAAQAQHVQNSSQDAHTRCKTATAGSVSFRVTNSEADELDRARLLMKTALGASLVSLFFGGVLVSALGLLAAIICLVKFNAIGKNQPNDPRIARYLRRSGIIAVVVSIAALALNVAIAIAMYPVVREMLESGNLDQLFSMPGAGGAVDAVTPDSTGSITWG